MSESEVLLDVDDLRVGFSMGHSITATILRRRRPVLRACDGVDLEIRRGEIVGLVGESGSGKSTVARSVLGLTDLSGGRMMFDGTDISAGIPAVRRSDIQMVFQDPSTSLNPRRTVGSILAELLRAHAGGGSAGAEERVDELLAAVGLGPRHATMRPGQLSGGQRQRVAIARALATDPSLIIADEAVSALDVSVQAAILNLIRDLVDERRLAVLFITHDLTVLGAIADRVAVMYLGRVVESGPTDEVLRSPRHPYTAALLAAAPRILGGKPGAGRLTGEVPSPIDLPTGCRFHPRCPSATETCRSVDPVVVTLGGTSFECHHPLAADG